MPNTSTQAASIPATPPLATAHAGATPVYSWIVLTMLLVIYVFNFLDRQLMSILIEPIKAEMGFTDTQMGYMTGFWFALFYTGFGVIVGFLADRTSRLRILFAGAFLWSLFTVLCGFAKTYPTMLAARIGVGVGEAAGAPPSYSILADYFPPHKRGLALGLFSLGVPFGQALGAAFGAKVHELWGWRAAFIGIGLAGLVASFLLLLIVREPRRGAMDGTAHVTAEQALALASEKSGFLATLWDFFSRPMLVWTALGTGLCALVGYSALGWNVSFLVRVKGINYGEVALYYALMLAVAMGLGIWISGLMADRLSGRSKVWYAFLPCIAMTASAPFWLAYVWAPNWELAIAFLVVPTLLMYTYLVPTLALLQGAVKPSQRTMASAILLMVLNMVGLGVGPTMVGAMSDAFANGALARGADAAAAAAIGLQTAFYWITPFFLFASALLLLQASATAREEKAGRAIYDGGARLGFVLLLIGVCGGGALGLNPPENGLFGDGITATQVALLTLSTLFGGYLTMRAAMRKPTQPAAPKA